MFVVRFAEAASVFHGAYDPGSNSVVIHREITDGDQRTLEALWGTCE